METWMDATMLIEATMLSFLVALWIAWMSLRGLFQLMPAKRLESVSVLSVPRQSARAMGRQTA